MNITSEEFEIIGCIREEALRRIILFILEHKLCTFNEIVEYIKPHQPYPGILEGLKNQE